MRALVIGGNLEADPGSRRSLLENQRDAFALEPLLFGAGIFGGLELGRKREKKFDFRRGEIAKRQEAAVFQVE